MPDDSFRLRTEFITLGQLLKATGFIDEGWQARGFLADAKITVNGEPDNRRGRKIRPGDEVVVDGNSIRIEG